MSAIVEADDKRERAARVLKFLNPRLLSVEGARSRFKREALAVAMVPNEHIVRLFEVGELPSGVPYIVMERLEGKDLDELLEDEGAPGFPIPRAVHITLQLLGALQAAHALGIVHRDMKLSNCFVVRGGIQPDFVKVLDFGVSKLRVPSATLITRWGAALGTPGYMAPEQAISPRDADARSDLYSVGVILYALLSGELPVRLRGTSPAELLRRILREPPIPLRSVMPDLPIELAAVVHAAMAKEPADRPQTAKDMARALAPWADGRSDEVLRQIECFDPDAAPRAAPVPEAPDRARAARIARAVVALVFVALAFALGASLSTCVRYAV